MKQSNNGVYKHIIFDLFGVLFAVNKLSVSHHIGLFDAAFYMLRYRRSPLDLALSVLDKIAKNQDYQDCILQYKNYFLPQYVHDFNRGLRSSQETICETQYEIEKLATQNYFTSDLEKKIATNVLKIFFTPDLIVKAADPVKEVIDIVKQVKKNHDVFLLSNIDTESISLLQANYVDVFSLFDGIVLSCEAQLLKPDHAIFKHVTDRYQLKPKECIFIDDQKENIEAAQSFGIHSILFRNARGVKNELRELDIGI